jgi:hypothetical protein
MAQSSNNNKQHFINKVHVYVSNVIFYKISCSCILLHTGDGTYIIIIIADVPEWNRALDNKAKWLVQQCINGVSSNPVDGECKFASSRFNSNSAGLKFQLYDIKLYSRLKWRLWKKEQHEPQ